MERFENLIYQPIDFLKFRKDYQNHLDMLEQARDYDTFKKQYFALQALMDEINTNLVICSIRNSINTLDTFYDEEQKKNNEGMARLVDLKLKEANIILASPFKQELIQDFGELFIKDLEVNLKLDSEEIIDLQIKESELGNQYAKLTANAKTNFMGQELNFYGLLKYLEDNDRMVRKESFKAWANLYESISEDLDDIYDQMIAIRNKKTIKLGFNNYLEYIYLYRGRYDYNEEDVLKFREGIKKYIVPLATKIQEDQKKELKLDKFCYYDEKLFFKDGNPTPKGTTLDKVQSALKMYNELSKETSEYFNFMVKHNLFSLDSTKVKKTGGYCTTLAKYKSPFIFANFNCTSADIDVLTHEAGHGFQCYLAFRNLKLSSQVWSTMDIAEIYSMAMEHFAYPYMSYFYGDDAKRYLYYHLAGAILTIPYLVMVDDFQHQVFKAKNPTKEERRKIWKQLEKEYLPMRDYDDNEFMNQGAFWMQKQHIFLSPFYYIDYALAQMVAFEFYLDDQVNHEKAFQNYMAMAKIGASKGYKATLDAGKRLSPFDEKNIKAITDLVASMLENYQQTFALIYKIKSQTL